ncbi:von willebrand factor [Colletotrichum tofieldiae]|nr:von willebrand factor [Colletotrichum tofieldiae]
MARRRRVLQEEDQRPRIKKSRRHVTGPENTTSNAPAADSSNTDSSQRQPPAQGSAEPAQQKQPLALPPLPEPSSGGNSAGGNGNGTITLDMSGGEGASTKLDHLGPLVVNQDGTMSRISNWGEMTEIERRNTLRILGKRNQIRLAGLRGEGNGTGDGADRG